MRLKVEVELLGGRLHVSQDPIVQSYLVMQISLSFVVFQSVWGHPLLHETCEHRPQNVRCTRDLPMTKLTFGKRAQIRGAVATSRSIPFR